jgi:hypothetical protein
MTTIYRMRLELTCDALRELIGILTTDEVDYSKRYDMAGKFTEDVQERLCEVGLTDISFWPYDDGYDVECLKCLEVARETLADIEKTIINIDKVMDVLT